MASMGRVISGLAYPDRFFAAASYAGFDGSSKCISARFPNDVALLLYALHQQATVGTCTIPKPRGWNPVEQSKWTSWHGLGNMASTEAMRLFVKILEEEEPGWYSKVSDFVADPVIDVEINNNPKFRPVTENGNSYPETMAGSTENCCLLDSLGKDISSEGLCSVGVYDQWVAPSVSGQYPKPRYEHGAAVVQDKMYIFGGNHNGRYLNDLHVLDLRCWAWSMVDVKAASSVLIPPCAGHSLIPWDNKLLSIAGHTKDPSENIQVKLFDLQTCTWSILKTYGKPPVSRGGQSVTLVGSTLVIFGGQDAKKSLLNDLHILDLETLTWDEIDAVGVPPSPRSGHAAAIHAEQFILIFGGGSHAMCFNDLHVLDLKTMEWSRITQKGYIPSPRAGHASVTVGDNWFLVGGGDNKSGVSETVVLNMSTFVWSVVSTVQGRVPLASEGMSLVVRCCKGEDIVVCFGGYNGRYNNEVNVLKVKHKSVDGGVSLVDKKSNADRSIDLEFEKNRQVVDNGKAVEAMVMNNAKSGGESDETVCGAKEEKEKVESLVEEEKILHVQLKQEVEEAETRCEKLIKEVRSARVELDREQSRCFKLEVDVAELRQKLQGMEALQKEADLLRRQKAAAAAVAIAVSEQEKQEHQSSGGVWSWLAGTPLPKQQNHH